MFDQTCEYEAACTQEGTHLRGDLFVCTEHAKVASHRVSDTEVRCSCGYVRPIGTSCGEPCL